MSTNSSNNDALNDADLAAVFADDSRSIHTTGPSAELDALIMKNAQASHQQQAATAVPETLQQKYAPVIATAAVLLIGIGLTPLNTNTSDINVSKPGSSLTEESMTQASDINRQVDTDALGTRQKELAKLDSSPARSIDSVTEPIEDSDALGELVTSANTPAEADELSVTQTPPPQELIRQAVISEDDRNVGSREIENVRNTNSTEKAASENAEMANDTNTEFSDTAQAFKKIEKQSIETASSTPLQKNSASSAAISEDALNNSSALETLTLQPSDAAPNALNSEATSISSAQENRQALALAAENSTDKNTLKQLKTEPQRDEVPSNTALKKQRTRPENFRRSPLLWIIEIKHLYTDEEYELAREELKAFREKYPGNTNERLLPEALQTLKFD